MSIHMSKWVACGALTLGVCLLAGVASRGADDDKKLQAEVNKAVIALAEGKGDAKDLAKKYAIENVMRSLKLRDKGGIGIGKTKGTGPDGIEARLINLGKKAPTKGDLSKQGDDLTKAAEIVVAIGKISEYYAPKEKKGDKDPKVWKKYNEEMIKNSKDLVDAIKSADGMQVKAAATKVNQACNECHSIFRDN